MTERRATWRLRPVLRGALSLAELVVALAIGTLLFAGLSSALLIARAALPDTSAPYVAARQGQDVLEDLAADLSLAVSFSERTASAVTFTVPDRTGDGLPETIRYAWAGSAGDPLVRTFNGTDANLLGGIQSLKFSYQVTSLTQTEPGTPPGELLFGAFESWPGIGNPTVTEYALSISRWAGESFVLDLPADATEIRVTRAQVKLRRQAGATGVVQARIYGGDGGGTQYPAGPPLGSSAVKLISSLPPGHDWVEFLFPNAELTDPKGTYFLIITASTNSNAYLQYLFAFGAPLTGTYMVWTTDSGASWQPSGGLIQMFDCPFRVYGTYTPPGGDVTRHYVRGVTVALQPEPGDGTTLTTAVRTLNEPEVSAP